VASLLALGGALCWGAGDFLGGLAARRVAVLAVLTVSQAVGLAGVALWVVVARDPVPDMAELLPAALAGIAGLVGLGALYRGLAVGAMGIVAPISAASPLVPLAVDAARGVVPGAVQWLGSRSSWRGSPPSRWSPRAVGLVASGVGLALVAALGFGLFFVGLDAGADERSLGSRSGARGFRLDRGSDSAPRDAHPLRPPGRSCRSSSRSASSTRAPTCLSPSQARGTRPGSSRSPSALYPIVTVVLARHCSASG
jgi:uncharacterized membrane protein